MNKGTSTTTPATLTPELPVQLKAFTDAAADAVARTLASVIKEAERAEQLRQAEHRAFMAEQRETVSGLLRKAEERLATVKDGRDGTDGKDGADADMGALTKRVEELVAAIPVPENGKDGRDGERGEKGEQGAPGDRGEQGAAGSDGVDGAAGRDGVDADMSALEKRLEELVAAIPVPQDGKDGADGKDAYPGEAKGLYDPEATYRALDVVTLNGSEWRAKVDDPGALPGDGWMLSAQRGKRGDRGERGEKGGDGRPGTDGAQPVALKFDETEMKFLMVLDDGNQLEADFYPVAKAIRGDPE